MQATGEPGYLTKNGEGDLVVMDIEVFTRRETMLKLREELLAVEEDRLSGREGTTLDELDNYLASIINEAEHVIPFDVKIPAAKPIALSDLTEIELNKELEKGYTDFTQGNISK